MDISHASFRLRYSHIVAILCVTSFELSRASLEARTHLQALNTIRSLERHKADSKLPIMFEGLDLLHSSEYTIHQDGREEDSGATRFLDHLSFSHMEC